MFEFFDEISLKYRLSEQTNTIFPIDNRSKDLLVIFLKFHWTIGIYWHFCQYIKKFPDIIVRVAFCQVQHAARRLKLFWNCYVVAFEIVQKTATSNFFEIVTSLLLKLLCCCLGIRTQTKKLEFKASYHWTMLPLINIHMLKINFVNFIINFF